MRTLSTAIQNAIASEDGVKPSINLEVSKSRVFWDAIDRDNAVSFAESTPAVTETPIGEDVTYTSGSIVGVASNDDKLYLMIDTDSTEKLIYSSGSGPLSTLTECKPGITGEYLYYCTGTQVVRATLDYANMTSGSCPISASEVVATTSYKGSLHAISETQAVFVYIDDGGVGVTYYEYDGGWNEYTYNQRFMYRTQVYSDASDDNIHLLVYSAAVETSNGIFVYVYDYNGSVSVVQRLENGAWSDVTTAVPSDLSEFRITNAIVKNDRVFLAGQFVRTLEFHTTSIHNLVLWSDDGKTFSLDRFTMFSTLGWRFHICDKDDDLVFACTNRVLESDAPWYFSQDDCDYITISSGSAISLSGSATSGWGIELASPYINNEYIEVGNRILIQLGYMTSGSMSYFDFDTCIISTVTLNYADGERSVSINALSEGLWRTSTLTHPFYMEFNSKQASHDRVQDMSNFYEAGDSSNCFDIPFMADFADESGKLLGHKEIDAGSDFTYWTIDLEKTEITTYPVLDSFPYTGELYGWSRAGQWDLNPNTSDSTPTSSENCKMTLMLLVEHSDGDQEEIEITDLASTYERFPRTYFSAAAGSLPIEYTIDETGGLVSGDKLIKVGIKSYNENASGKAVIMVARVEIPDLMMCVPPPKFEDDGIEEDDIIVINPALPVFDGTFDQSFPFPDGWITLTSYSDTQLVFTWHKNNYQLYNEIWPCWYIDWNTTEIITEMTIEILIPPSAWINHVFWSDNSFINYYGNFNSIGGNLYQFTGSITQEANPYRRESICAKLKAPNGTGTYNFVYNIISVNNTPYNVEERSQMPAELDEDGDLIPENKLTIKQRGRPKIYFAVKPYTAFNFDIWAYTNIVGDNGCAGLVGLAEDANNYIVARWTTDLLEIVKVRSKVETVLASTAISWASTERIRFSHENGVFSVRRIVSDIWESPVLSYTWQYSDGALTTSEDIHHVGIYGFIDTPGLGLRTTSFADSSSNGIIPILPGYADGAYDDLPSSGVVEIDGQKYSYTGKSTEMTNIRGPYQIRTLGVQWSYNNPNDGKAYNGNAMSFYYFDWRNNNSYWNYHNSNYVGTNVTYAFSIDAIDWKWWITTGGQVVYLRNRMRLFSSDITGSEYMGTGDKVWVTHALTGVTKESEDSYYHSEGSFIIYTGDGTDEEAIEFKEYCACNGNQDASVEDMLDKVSRIAGASSSFPGDTLYTSLGLTSEVTI